MARSDPSTIDAMVIPHLLSPSLAKDLLDLIRSEISTSVTPELHWGGNPARNYWPSCLIHATLLGRAFALLFDIDAVAKAEGHQEGRTVEEQREEVWKSVSDVFIKAVFSGSEPEPGSRLAMGVLMLTCGKTISEAMGLRGTGKRWMWYDDNIEQPEEEWDWEELKQALMDTEKLPRNHTDPTVLEKELKITGGPVPEYVPQEVLNILDRARSHVKEGKGDLTSQEIVQLQLL